MIITRWKSVALGLALAGLAHAGLAVGRAEAQDGDVYGQTARCLEIIAKALADAGASLEHVTRTRIILTDIALWKDAARAHAEAFADIRPVTTLMQVTAFVDPDWLVEIEVDAVIPD